MREFGSYSVSLQNFRFKKRVVFDTSVGYTVDYVPAIGLEQTGVLQAEYLFVDREIKQQGGGFAIPPPPCNYYDIIKSYSHSVPLRTQGPYTVGITGYIFSFTTGGFFDPECFAELKLNIAIDHATGLEKHTQSNADLNDPCAVPHWNGGPYTEYLPLRMEFGVYHRSPPIRLGDPPVCAAEMLNLPVTDWRYRHLNLGSLNLPLCLCRHNPANPQPTLGGIGCNPCGLVSPGFRENVPYPPCPGSDPSIRSQQSLSIEIAEPSYS